MTAETSITPTLTLDRWTVTSGSRIQSRGAVVIASADHEWQASAEGNGAVDALFGAVDKALADILHGHPRLVGYDVHAVAEGPGAEGVVTVRIAPPPEAPGERASGEYAGEARSTNIIAASVDAYLGAINQLLGEAHWAGAADTAGATRRARRESDRGARAEMDEDAAHHDTTAWFNPR